jgi:hypothetical protein
MDVCGVLMDPPPHLLVILVVRHHHRVERRVLTPVRAEVHRVQCDGSGGGGGGGGGDGGFRVLLNLRLLGGLSLPGVHSIGPTEHAGWHQPVCLLASTGAFDHTAS